MSDDSLEKELKKMSETLKKLDEIVSKIHEEIKIVNINLIDVETAVDGVRSREL